MCCVRRLNICHGVIDLENFKGLKIDDGILIKITNELIYLDHEKWKCLYGWQFVVAPLRGFMEDLVTAVIAEVFKVTAYPINNFLGATLAILFNHYA